MTIGTESRLRENRGRGQGVKNRRGPIFLRLSKSRVNRRPHFARLNKVFLSPAEIHTSTYVRSRKVMKAGSHPQHRSRAGVYSKVFHTQGMTEKWQRCKDINEGERTKADYNRGLRTASKCDRATNMTRLRSMQTEGSRTNASSKE